VFAVLHNGRYRTVVLSQLLNELPPVRATSLDIVSSCRAADGGVRILRVEGRKPNLLLFFVDPMDIVAVSTDPPVAKESKTVV
jgi:hypothetical protein